MSQLSWSNKIEPGHWFRWGLYQIPDSYSDGLAGDYTAYVVDTSQWASYASTGLNVDNLAFDAGLFSTFPRDGFSYRVVVTVQRVGATAIGRPSAQRILVTSRVNVKSHIAISTCYDHIVQYSTYQVGERLTST